MSWFGKKKKALPGELPHVTLSDGTELVTLPNGSQVAFQRHPVDGTMTQVAPPPSPPLLFQGVSDAASEANRRLNALPEEVEPPPTPTDPATQDALDQSALQAISIFRPDLVPPLPMEPQRSAPVMSPPPPLRSYSHGGPVTALGSGKNGVLTRLRAKYPQYHDLSDHALALGVLKKYPQYRDVLGPVVAQGVRGYEEGGAVTFGPRLRPAEWWSQTPTTPGIPDRITNLPVDQAYAQGINTMGVGPPIGLRDWLDAIAHTATDAALMRGGFEAPPFSKVMQSNKPIQVYHGTPHGFDSFDMSKTDPHALFGPGFYFTENPVIAGGRVGEKSVRVGPFASEQEALQQPGRNYFAWQDQPGQWITTVPTVEKKGYAHAIPRNLSIPEEFRHLVVQEITRPSAHWQSPGYLTQSELEHVAGQLKEFEKSGNLARLEAAIHAQPYNINVTQAARRAGAALTAPNVRPALLDITKPFRADDIIGEGLQRKLATVIDKKFGQGTSDYALERLETMALDRNILGEDAYRAFAHYALDNNGKPIGPAAINAALQALGFDGITHIGGTRTGNEAHRVWIAFRPEQIHSPFEYATKIRGYQGGGEVEPIPFGIPGYWQLLSTINQGALNPSVQSLLAGLPNMLLSMERGPEGFDSEHSGANASGIGGTGSSSLGATASGVGSLLAGTGALLGGGKAIANALSGGPASTSSPDLSIPPLVLSSPSGLSAPTMLTNIGSGLTTPVELPGLSLLGNPLSPEDILREGLTQPGPLVSLTDTGPTVDLSGGPVTNPFGVTGGLTLDTSLPSPPTGTSGIGTPPTGLPSATSAFPSAVAGLGLLSALTQLGSTVTNPNLSEAQKGLGTTANVLQGALAASQLPAVRQNLPAFSEAMQTRIPTSTSPSSVPVDVAGAIPVDTAAASQADVLLGGTSAPVSADPSGGGIPIASAVTGALKVSMDLANQNLTDNQKIVYTGIDAAVTAGSLAMPDYALAFQVGGDALKLALMDFLKPSQVDLPRPIRDALELAHDSAYVNTTFGQRIGNAETPDDIWNLLVSNGSGYTGGMMGEGRVATIATLKTPVTQADVDRGDVVLPTGFTSLNQWAQSTGQNPAHPPVFAGNPNPYYPVWTSQAFLQRVTANPDELQLAVQSGITPGRTGDINLRLERAVTGRLAVMRQLSPTLTALNASRPGQDPFILNDLSAAFNQARAQGLPTNGAALLPAMQRLLATRVLSGEIGALPPAAGTDEVSVTADPQVYADVATHIDRLGFAAPNLTPQEQIRNAIDTLGINVDPNVRLTLDTQLTGARWQDQESVPTE